jgi:hypothetical protein
MRQYVPDCCIDLVFNVDEVGISECETHIARKVMVPISTSDQTLHHGEHCNLKRISMECCLSASGESLILFLVSSQVNDSGIEGLKAKAFRMRVDRVVEYRQKPYMSAALFRQSVTAVLIPFINALRANDQFAGKPAIMLMDNSSLHRRPDILTIFREHEVKFFAFPPHMIEIFQTLELSLFGM